MGIRGLHHQILQRAHAECIARMCFKNSVSVHVFFIFISCLWLFFFRRLSVDSKLMKKCLCSVAALLRTHPLFLFLSTLQGFSRYCSGNWVIQVFGLALIFPFILYLLPFSLIPQPPPSFFPLQSFHSDSDRPDVYTGSDVGVRGLPVSRGPHSGHIYLHYPQQPAGSAGLHHALPAV